MKTTLFVLVLFAVTTVTGQTTLDLNKMTLNDSVIKDLNIEILTNMLGRPSAVKRPYQAISNNYFGPEVYYHEKGLKFTFPTKKSDSLEHVERVDVYLVKVWDSDNNEFYIPFQGKIIPQLTANLKANDVITLFKNYLVDVEDAESIGKRLSVDAKRAGFEFDPYSIHYDLIKVKNKENRIDLHCEEYTKFLESFSIWWYIPKQQYNEKAPELAPIYR
jgi:hypothetical protein